jgi:hypothetical protein
MVLLSGAMRAAAFSGESEPIHHWMAGRQRMPWAGQWMPARPRRPDHSAALADLSRLHASGVIDDREYEQLRARVTA